MDIDGVSLLDKRGYHTICISHLREGRMYLRKQKGVRDWFNIIQVVISFQFRFTVDKNIFLSFHFPFYSDTIF